MPVLAALRFAVPYAVQSRLLVATHRQTLQSPKRSIFHEGRLVRHIRDEWTVDMGRDAHGKRRGSRTLDVHLFFQNSPF